MGRTGWCFEDKFILIEEFNHIVYELHRVLLTTAMLNFSSSGGALLADPAFVLLHRLETELQRHAHDADVTLKGFILEALAATLLAILVW